MMLNMVFVWGESDSLFPVVHEPRSPSYSPPSSPFLKAKSSESSVCSAGELALLESSPGFSSSDSEDENVQNRKNDQPIDCQHVMSLVTEAMTLVKQKGGSVDSLKRKYSGKRRECKDTTKKLKKSRKEVKRLRGECVSTGSYINELQQENDYLREKKGNIERKLKDVNTLYEESQDQNKTLQTKKRSWVFAANNHAQKNGNIRGQVDNVISALPDTLRQMVKNKSWHVKNTRDQKAEVDMRVLENLHVLDKVSDANAVTAPVQEREREFYVEGLSSPPKSKKRKRR